MTLEIYDKNLLNLLEGWTALINKMYDLAKRIPGDTFEVADELVAVRRCEVAAVRRCEVAADGMLSAARLLVNAAEDAGLISYDDRRTINHILWFAGSDEDVLTDWGVDDDDNPDF